MSGKATGLGGQSTMYLRVTERIRSEIISGRLKPNDRLKVPELALSLGVSPSPVREAIQKLQAEGLIILKPNHGAVVRNIDATEFTQLMRMRAAIEGMQASLSARLGNSTFLVKLETQVDRFDKAVKAGDQEARLKANAAIHKLINGIDNSLIAQDMLGRIDAITAAVRRQWPLRPDRLLRAQEEHRQLLQSIREKDEELAGSVARNHVLSTLEDVLEIMGIDKDRHDPGGIDELT